jgi:hypothetical protein
MTKDGAQTEREEDAARGWAVGGAGTLGASEDCNPGEVAYVEEGDKVLHLEGDNMEA